MLAALVLLDSRPGAIENIFVTKTPNDVGIYAMTLYINGEAAVVHVDDFVPTHNLHKFGKWGDFPIFVDSTVEGEIWPMVAEKVWAKVTGSYSNAEGGAPSWALKHLTNDPAE